MTLNEINEFLLAFEGAHLDFPFGEENSLYKNADGKIFAIVAHESKPLKLSLKCDPALAERLRETYETVMAGYHLNKKNWNTILLTGQVDDEELKSLMILSYNLSREK
jgi:predicted DNA-binding protein (MmcQ/YjbR family)